MFRIYRGSDLFDACTTKEDSIMIFTVVDCINSQATVYYTERFKRHFKERYTESLICGKIYSTFQRIFCTRLFSPNLGGSILQPG